MEFPLYLNIAGQRIHPHPVFEALAYCSAFQLYVFLRARWARFTNGIGAAPELSANLQFGLLVASGVGAMLGSKLLAWLEWPAYFWQHRDPLDLWIGGKTIVGGLLGGWAGIEIAKKIAGVRASTGDVFVFPLILAMAIGRIGCFLTGLEDHTHGTPSSLPWAVDFGDGIPRHPTQLYEIVFLAALALFFRIRMRSPFYNGELFRTFMLLYLAFRFAIDFLKPGERPLVLSAIQIASAFGVLFCAWQLVRLRKETQHVAAA